MSPQVQHMHFNEKEPVAQLTAPVQENPRTCGMRRRTFFVALIALAVVVIALGVGLGVGLGLSLKKNSNEDKPSNPYCRDHPELCIGGALNANYYSTQGAFNGSGIALAGESWNKNQRRIFTLYFQHHTGDLRFMQYTTNRQWIGGTKSETVATNAKEATPISAVAYALNNTQYFHLFYISKNNTIKQITFSNTTNLWEPGPLSDLNLKAFDSPSVGLQACWKGNFYGDSDYSKFPTTNGQANNIPFEERIGMNLWYASDESTFEQYAWYNGKDTWARLSPWQGKNGHAGVGCYSWGVGTTTYAMMANKNNDTEIWWKDTNTTLTSEDAHPINSWVNATNAAIRGVYPSTSFGYTTYFYAQMADRSVQGFNISFNAENTTIENQDTFTITDPAGPVVGLGGTHLTNTAYAETQQDGNVTKTLWDSLYVFYQTEGNDITAFTRPIAGGEWSQGRLKIPNE